MRENCDYFGLLRRLCDKRVPPLMEENSRPPTPLAEAIFKMIVQPLKMLGMFTGADYKSTM